MLFVKRLCILRALAVKKEEKEGEET